MYHRLTKDFIEAIEWRIEAGMIESADDMLHGAYLATNDPLLHLDIEKLKCEMVFKYKYLRLARASK